MLERLVVGEIEDWGQADVVPIEGAGEESGRAEGMLFGVSHDLCCGTAGVEQR